MKRRHPVHMLALALGVVAAVPSIAAADTSFPAAAAGEQLVPREQGRPPLRLLGTGVQ